MILPSEEQQAQLEALIDQTSLAGVVASLASICAQKSEHILENWQDHCTAATWARDAHKLDVLAEKLENR